MQDQSSSDRIAMLLAAMARFPSQYPASVTSGRCSRNVRPATITSMIILAKNAGLVIERPGSPVIRSDPVTSSTISAHQIQVRNRSDSAASGWDRENNPRILRSTRNVAEITMATQTMWIVWIVGMIHDTFWMVLLSEVVAGRAPGARGGGGGGGGAG